MKQNGWGRWGWGLGALMLVASGATATRAEQSCGQLSAEERASCPLGFGHVERVEDIPGGVRIVYERGTVPAAHMRSMLGCQAAAARPAVPRSCTFVSAATGVDVRDDGGRTMVELTAAPGGDEAVLRTRVRIHFDADLRVGDVYPR